MHDAVCHAVRFPPTPPLHYDLNTLYRERFPLSETRFYSSLAVVVKATHTWSTNKPVETKYVQ